MYCGCPSIHLFVGTWSILHDNLKTLAKTLIDNLGCLLYTSDAADE